MQKASSLDSCWKTTRTEESSFEDHSLGSYQPLLDLDHCFPLSPTDNEDSTPLVTNNCCMLPEPEHDEKEFVRDSWEPICGNQTSGVHGNDVTKLKEDDSGNSSMSSAGSLDGESVGGRTRSSSSDSKSEPDIELAKILERHGDYVLERNAKACENDTNDCCGRKLCDIDEGVLDMDHASRLDHLGHHLSCTGTERHMNNEKVQMEQQNGYVVNRDDPSDAGTPIHVPTSQIMRNSCPYNCSPSFREQDYFLVDETPNVDLSSFPHSITGPCSPQPSPLPINAPNNSHGVTEVSCLSVNSTYPTSTPCARYALPSTDVTPLLPDHEKCLAIPHEAHRLQPQSWSSCHTTMCSSHCSDSLPPAHVSSSSSLCHSNHCQHLPTSTITKGPFNPNTSSAGSVYTSAPYTHNAYNENQCVHVNPANRAARTQETWSDSNCPQGHSIQRSIETPSHYLVPQHRQWNKDYTTEPAKGLTGKAQYNNNVQHYNTTLTSATSSPPALVQSYMPQNASFPQYPNELQAKLQEMNVNGLTRLPPPNMVIMVPMRQNTAHDFTANGTRHGNKSQIFNVGLSTQHTMNSMDNSGNRDHQSVSSSHHSNPTDMKEWACPIPHQAINCFGQAFNNDPRYNVCSAVPSSQPYQMRTHQSNTHQHPFYHCQEAADSRHDHHVVPKSPFQNWHDSQASIQSSYSHVTPDVVSQHSFNTKTLTPSLHSFSDDTQNQDGSSDHTHNQAGSSDHTHNQAGSSDPTHNQAGCLDHTQSQASCSDHTQNQANSSVTATNGQATQLSNQVSSANDEITRISDNIHQSAGVQRENALSNNTFPEPGLNPRSRIPDRGSDDFIPMTEMDDSKRSDDANTPGLRNSDSTNLTEGQGNHLIHKRYCPDYRQFCIVATLVNPVFGVLALLANRRAKHLYRLRHINAATNLYFFTILFCSFSFFTTTIIGFMVFAKYHILSPCVIVPVNKMEVCHGAMLGYDEDLQNFYKLDKELYCQLLSNPPVMDAISHFYLLKMGIYNKHKNATTAKVGESKKLKKPNEAHGKPDDMPKFAPPLPGGLATSQIIEGRDAMDKCYNEWLKSQDASSASTTGKLNTMNQIKETTKKAAADTTFSGLIDGLATNTPLLSNNTMAVAQQPYLSNNTNTGNV